MEQTIVVNRKLWKIVLANPNDNVSAVEQRPSFFDVSGGFARVIVRTVVFDHDRFITPLSLDVNGA